jgi:hypothetical protein
LKPGVDGWCGGYCMGNIGFSRQSLITLISPAWPFSEILSSNEHGLFYQSAFVGKWNGIKTSVPWNQCGQHQATQVEGSCGREFVQLSSAIGKYVRAKRTRLDSYS